MFATVRKRCFGTDGIRWAQRSRGVCRKAVDMNDRNVLFRPYRGCFVAPDEVPLDDRVMPAPCDDEVCDFLADDDNEEESEYPSADVGASEGQF